MGLEQALAEHEELVDKLIKDAAKYLRTLKAWKAACRKARSCFTPARPVKSPRRRK